MNTFAQPSRDDFLRILMGISEAAHAEAQAKDVEIQSMMAKDGTIGNSRHPLVLAAQLQPIHKDYIDKSMEFTARFAEQSGIGLDELCDVASECLKQRVVVFSTPIMRAMRISGTPQNQGIIASQRKPFEAQIDESIKNLKVGFVGAKSVAMKPADTIQAKALRILQLIYEETRAREEPAFVEQMGGQLGIRIEDVHAAWRYLRDKSLIQTFKLPYTARISALGIDAIEAAQLLPDQTTPSFPSITYNITIHGTGSGSQVNLASSGSIQVSQLTNADPAAIQQLARGVDQLVEQIRASLPSLPATMREEVSATVRDLSNAAKKKDPTLLTKGLESLGRILEGAAGSLLAVGAQSVIQGLLAIPLSGN